jgi:hypothetical protein
MSSAGRDKVARAPCYDPDDFGEVSRGRRPGRWKRTFSTASIQPMLAADDLGGLSNVERRIHIIAEVVDYPHTDKIGKETP